MTELHAPVNAANTIIRNENNNKNVAVPNNDQKNINYNNRIKQKAMLETVSNNNNDNINNMVKSSE